MVLIAKKSGVMAPLMTKDGGPSSADEGAVTLSVTPSASTAAILPLAGLVSAFG